MARTKTRPLLQLYQKQDTTFAVETDTDIH